MPTRAEVGVPVPLVLVHNDGGVIWAQIYIGG